MKQEGKHIYDESKKDFLELREYTVMMINHLHWENRTQYFELIEQFLNGLDLRKKYRAINRLEAELILFEPEDFDDLISEIIILFDRYCPDPSLRESYEFSEEELKNLIQKILIEMKNRYP